MRNRCPSAGRAILHAAKNLLLDESTSGLDVPTVRSLRNLPRRLRDAGTCALFSSHVLKRCTCCTPAPRDPSPAAALRQVIMLALEDMEYAESAEVLSILESNVAARLDASPPTIA